MIPMSMDELLWGVSEQDRRLFAGMTPQQQARLIEQMNQSKTNPASWGANPTNYYNGVAKVGPLTSQEFGPVTPELRLAIDRKIAETHGVRTPAEQSFAEAIAPTANLPVDNGATAQAMKEENWLEPTTAAAPTPGGHLFGGPQTLDLAQAGADKTASAAKELVKTGTPTVGGAAMGPGKAAGGAAATAAGGAAGGPMGMMTAVGGMMLSSLLGKLLQSDEATPVAAPMQLTPGEPYQAPEPPAFAAVTPGAGAASPDMDWRRYVDSRLFGNPMQG